MSEYVKGAVAEHAKALVPSVARHIASEEQKVTKDFEKELSNAMPAEHRALPEVGLKKDAVVKVLQRRADADKALWDGLHKGKVSGTVYHGGAEIQSLLEKSYGMFSLANPLHSDLFNNCRNMEAEVISMVGALFGQAQAAGCVTTGGTESILMACKGARDWGIKVKGISANKTNMVVPVTAHAAFDKASQYFGIEIRKIERVSQGDALTDGAGEVDIAAMERAVDANTVLILGSAPNFPNGTIDDLWELNRIAGEKGTCFHVDGCLGGFLLPFMAEHGYNYASFNGKLVQSAGAKQTNAPAAPRSFSFASLFTDLPNVTSLSVDPHKYGFTAKGTSVLLYRDRDIRRYQYCPVPDWTGGIYATPTVTGSRPGGLAATAYASMLYMGKDGYRKSSKQILDATKTLARALSSGKDGEEAGALFKLGLRQIGRDDVSVVCFGLNGNGVRAETEEVTPPAGSEKQEDGDEKFGKPWKLSIYGVNDCLKARFGWILNGLQNPGSAHIAFTLPTSTPEMVQQLINDLTESMKICRGLGPGGAAEARKFCGAGTAAVYGMATSVPKSIAGEICKLYIDACYEAY